MEKISTRTAQLAALSCLLFALNTLNAQWMPFDRTPGANLLTASEALGIPLNTYAPESVTKVNGCACTATSPSGTVNIGTFSGGLDPNGDVISAEQFFDYDNAIPFSSNTGYEVANNLTLMLYEDANCVVSLLIFVDAPNDTQGGSGTMSITGLTQYMGVISNDDGELVDNGGTINGTFDWPAEYNDGGIVTGIGCGQTFVITTNLGNINGASFVSGTGAFPNTTTLSDLSEITISCGASDGTCCPEDFGIMGQAFNASCPNSPDGAYQGSISNGVPPYLLQVVDENGNIVATGTENTDNFQFNGLPAGNYTILIIDSNGELLNGCEGEDNFTIDAANDAPIAPPPPLIMACYDPIFGDAIIDLTQYEDQITGGNPDFSVLWFEDEFLTTPIPFPEAYETSFFGFPFVYFVLDDGTCLSEPVAVEIMFEPQPLASNYIYTACDDGGGTATFNLNQDLDLIAGGTPTTNSYWFTDPMGNNPIADPENYSSGDGTVYVQLENGNCVSDISPIGLDVIPTPEGNPQTLNECAGPDSTATFNLSAVADSIYMGDGDLAFWADSVQTDSIDSPMDYQSPSDTVYAFITEEGCVSNPVPIILNAIIVEPGPVDTIRLCDDGMGMAVFDLTILEPVLLGSNDSLRWYTDAAGTTLIPDPTAYSSDNAPVFYSLFLDGCESNTAEVMLIPLPTPLVQPDTLTACDDGSGNGIFDLTAADIITNGVGSVNWYEDAALSTPISDITAYVAGAGTVYAQAAQDSCLSAVVEVVLNVTTVDVADSAALEECGAQDGTAVFDLTSVEGDIYSGPGTVSWALNPDQSGPIADPANYTSPTNTVFAFATEDSCTSLPVPVSLTVIVSTPGADDSIEQCDDGMGGSVFDLTAIEGGLIGGADSLIWYEDDMATVPIPDPSMVTSSGSTVYYTLFVQSCESPAAAVELIPLPRPLVETDTLATCDEGGGQGLFDLTGADLITNGVGTLSYFEDAGAMQPIADPANYVSGAGTVYAQATEGSCSSAIVPIELELIAAVTATSDSLTLCGDGMGMAIFDLTGAEDDIRSGGGGIVNWYEDAGGATTIANPENYESGTATIYANVTAGSCVSDTVPVFLTVIPLPVANPASQQACADPVTGEGTFDLTALEPTVSGGAGSVSWFEDDMLTTPIADPANYTSADATVYATVFDGSCTSLPGEATLEVLPLPMTMPDTLRSCDNGSNTPVFDLTTANVTTTSGTTISWFENANGTGTIFDPANYPSTGGAVYAVVDDGNCTAPPVEVVLEAIFALSPEAVCAITANDSVGFSWLMVADSFSVTYNINGGTEIGPEIVFDTTFSVSMLDQGDVVNITVTALLDPLCTDGLTSTATCLADVCQPINFTYNLEDEYCSDEGSITLSATPAGGTFSGDGVTGNTLDLAGLSGSSFVFYDYYDAATDCDYRDSVTIEVFEPLPPTTISCDGITVNDITFNWQDVGATNYLVITEVEGVNDTIVTTALTTTVSGLSSETDVTITVTPQGPPPCGNGPATTETCTTLPCPPPPIAGEFVADEYCSDTSGVQLPGLYPGGIYSGPGVSGSTFDPSAAGAGEAVISFSFTDTANGCAYILEDTAQVIDPLTPPDISCAGATPNSVTFSWTGGNPGGYQYYYQVAGEAPTPIVTGPETELTVENITDLQDVTVYVSALGGAPCSNSPFDSLLCTSAPCPDVALSIDNLLPEYCTDEPAFALQGSPAGGTFSGPGITGDTLNPAAAGTGLIEIVYAYTDTTTDCSYVDTFSTSLFTPLETPVASCGDASPSSAGFSWTNVGADDYAISWTIDGSPAGSDVVTDTSYLITGLLPEQAVEMTIIAQGPPPCGNAEPVVISCASTPCPPISFEFTAPSPVCSEDAAIQLETTVVGSSPTGSVSWSGDGIVNADGLFDPATAPLGDNNITISYVDGVCSYDTTVVVNVHPQPEASFTVDGTFCSDSTLTLTFNGMATDSAVFSWELDGSTIEQELAGPQLIVSWPQPGTYELSLFIEDGGCTTDTFRQTVELIAPLVPPVISCEAEGYTSIVFSWDPVAGADSYDVSTSAGTGTLNGTTYTVTGLMPGESTTIEVTAIGTTPCGPVSSSLECSTPPCPDISFEFEAPSPVCSEDALLQLQATINNSNPEGIVIWSGDGIADTEGAFDPAAANLGDNLITITYDEAGVCVFDTTVTVFVHPQPEASFTVDGTFCSDSTLTLTFNGTATDSAAFNWELDGGSIVQELAGPQLIVSWPQPGTYDLSLQIEDGGCVSNLFTEEVELIAPLTEPDISCEPLNNTEILFSWPAVDGADEYDIVISNGTGSAQSATSYLVSGLLPEESVTITVTAIGSTPCGPVTSELTCSTPPCAPQSSSISGPADLCQGEDAVFEISLTGGITDDYQFNYLLNGQEDSIVLSSPGELNIVLENVQDTVEIELLSFFPLSNPVCVYDAGQSWQVNVMAPPTAGLALPPVVLCESADSVINLGERLDGETSGGSWSITSGGNPPGFDAAAGTQSTFAMPAGTYVYTYTASGMGICPDAREQVEITINPTPEVDAGDTQELSCNMGMVSIGSSSNPTTPGYSYFWSSETPGVVIGSPNIPIIETGQPGLYTLQITDPNGCTNTDQVEVTASLDAPVASFTANDPSCFGDTDGSILIDTISGGVPPFSITLNGDNVGSQTSFNNLPEGEYDIVITGQNGCFTEQQFTLVEPEPMTVMIMTDLTNVEDPDQIVLSFGDSVQLSAVTNSVAPIDTFIWRPEGDGSSFFFQPLQSGIVSVTAVDINGCTASDDLQIIVEKVRDVYVPNIFSPNGDGRNDRFYIQSGPQVVNIKEFRIFNRWGEPVFELVGDFPPNDPEYGWDGTHRGELMNGAVFVWYAEVEFNDGEIILLKGDVTLLR